MNTENSSTFLNPNFFIWLYQFSLSSPLLRGFSQGPSGDLLYMEGSYVCMKLLVGIFDFFLFFFYFMSFPPKVLSFNLVIWFVDNPYFLAGLPFPLPVQINNTV